MPVNMQLGSLRARFFSWAIQDSPNRQIPEYQRSKRLKRCDRDNRSQVEVISPNLEDLRYR